jgi:hypothetical protein
VAGAVEIAASFHGWLWRPRLAEARAEIAVARGAWHEAVRAASAAIVESRVRGRRKYEAAGLHTRARALAALGRTSEAVADLHAALQQTRGTGDSALFVRIAPALLALAGDDALAEEARALVAGVTQSLPDGQLRRSFVTSEPVRAISNGVRATE